MLPYLARRIANYAVLLFIATLLAYPLASASLGPSTLWDHQDPSLNWDTIHANLMKYDISHDLSVWGRYITWLRNVLFHWDWGRTPRGELISTLIGTKIFVSVRLVFLDAAVGMVGGVTLGAWAATRQYRFSDHAISLIFMIIISTPAMVIAILLQILAIQISRNSGFQIFEFTGEGEDAFGHLQHLLLPTLSMSLGSITSYSCFQRDLMLDTLSTDYMRIACAKGLIKRRVLTRHALRTVLIPMAIYFTFALATLFTGAAITEQVYGWHGMSGYSISAISGMDINGVTAVVASSGLCTLASAFLSDIFVAIVNPRVRVS